jgi:hypothetical protein
MRAHGRAKGRPRLVGRCAPRRRRRAALCSQAATLLTELDAFYIDHRLCGELDVGLDGLVVWLACDCGASMVRPADEGEGCAGCGDAVAGAR